jgi:hypothetical protein
MVSHTINNYRLGIQEDLPFKIEDARALEESHEDMRIKKLCKQIRLALHLIDEVMKDIKKEKTP